MNNRKLTLGRKAGKSFNDSSRWNRGSATHAYFGQLTWRFKSLQTQLTEWEKSTDRGAKTRAKEIKKKMSDIKAQVKAMYPKTHVQKISQLTHK